MRSPLQRVAEDSIRDAVTDGWAVTVDDLEYVPEGGGAYHWVARADGGRRLFVTCDDLGIKPWLGHDHDTVFRGLLLAYAAAMDLRAAGLTYVAAPVPSRSGAPAERLDDRHSVSVFEYVEGAPGRWGQPLDSGTGAELVRMLSRLHQSTPAVRSIARRGLDLSGRGALEDALGDLDHRWDGGPLANIARQELAENASTVAGWLSVLDRLALRLEGQDVQTTVTHGEPHPGNLIRTGGGLVLIDWDTVALSRPERDLWMIADERGDVARLYEDLTGITLDPDALRAHRLLWALADIAAFTAQLRGHHGRDADAERAVEALRSIFTGREPSPFGSPVP